MNPTGGDPDRDQEVVVEEGPDAVPEDLEEEPVVEAAIDEEEPEPLPGLELPEDPGEAIQLLVGELLATRAAAAEAVDRWQRSVAEFENYRKRARRDQAQIVARSAERVLAGLLPVLDSLDAALAMDPSGTSADSVRAGLSGTRDLLLSTLAREGMTPIEATGSEFDPAVHEAAQMGEGSGTMVVTAELRRGYEMKGRVVRAALVAVGYRDPDPPESTGEDDGSG